MRISPNEPIQMRPQVTAEKLDVEYKQTQPNAETSANSDDSNKPGDGLIHLFDFLKKKRARKKIDPKNERAVSLYRRIYTGEVEEKGKLFRTLA